MNKAHVIVGDAKEALQGVKEEAGKVTEIAELNFETMDNLTKIEHLLEFMQAQDATNEAVQHSTNQTITGMSQVVKTLESTRKTQNFTLHALTAHSDSDDKITKHLHDSEVAHGEMLEAIGAASKLVNNALKGVEHHDTTSRHALDLMRMREEKDEKILQVQEIHQGEVKNAVNQLERMQFSQGTAVHGAEKSSSALKAQINLLS